MGNDCQLNFNWTELANSFQEEGMPLFTLTQTYFPDINYLAFDPHTEIMENGDVMFDIKMKGLPMDINTEMYTNKCCALTWYERPYTPEFSKATVTAAYTGTTIPVANLDSYTKFNGLSVGDQVRVKSGATIVFKTVTAITPDAVNPTSITLDSSVTLAVGDSITKVGKTGVIGDCENSYCSTSKYQYKTEKKNSYFTRIPVCVDFTICDLNLDRRRYTSNNETIADYIKEVVAPFALDFNINFANKILFGANVPTRVVGPTTLASENMGVIHEMQSLQGKGCGNFLHDFSNCCLTATCDEDILQDLISKVLIPVKNSGVYNNGEEVVIRATSEAMQGIWNMNEAIKETFGGGGIMYRDITSETERILYNNRNRQFFIYMGLKFTFVHSQLLDSVFDNDSVLFFFPKSQFSIHQMPIAGVTATEGKVAALYNQGLPRVELYSNAEVNKALLGHSDCTSLKGHFTFATIWKHVGSGAYQLVTGFKSKKQCATFSCAAPLDLVEVNPAVCDGMTGVIS